MIAALDEAGFRVVLASSAREQDLEHFRSVLDMDDRVAGATSSGDADESKPDSEIFEVALHRYHLDRARTFVVGDTRWDAEAAERARLPFVAVETGGWTQAELVAAGAVATFTGPEALACAVINGVVRPDRSPMWAW